ncbi:hypothetical protein EAF04_008962 [Stromatinia cepivora]|nr:hypothetical protein EAF04_008962 [Stromatinia cepivora]
MSDSDINDTTGTDDATGTNEATGKAFVVLVACFGVIGLYTTWAVFFPFIQQTFRTLSSYISPLIASPGSFLKPETDIFTGNAETVRPVSSDAELKGDVVYIAEPTNANIKRNQGLIYFPNSPGTAPNNRALADEYARAGYLTIVINYWGRHQKIGRTQDEIEPWNGKNPKSEPSLDLRDRMITNAMNYLRDHRSCNQIGGVGYCAGAPPLMALLLQKPCRIQAAFIASPAHVRSQAYSKIQAPLSLAQSWDDRIVTVAQRHEQERELVNLVSLNEKENQSLPPVPWQMNLFSGVEHGFATKLLDRGRMTRDEIYAKRAAFSQSVMWFESYMPVVGKKLEYDTR